MAVNLSPYGGVGAQFLDNSGNVLTGGKIYTYAAGTTTPQPTYTTSVGNIPHSNPIILDAAGRVPSGGEIWLTDGLSYKFILRDANDVLIATYDNITGINSNFVAFTNQQEIQIATAGQTVFDLTTMQYQPGTNNLSVFVDGVNQYGPGAQYAYLETDSDTVTFVNGLHVGAEVKFTTSQLNSSALQANAFQVSYTPPFTGSAGTNVGAKLAQTVSVKDFGAVGDGITDDSTAIQAAFNASTNIYFPDGSYLIETGISVTDDNVAVNFGNAKIINGGVTFAFTFGARNDTPIYSTLAIQGGYFEQQNPLIDANYCYIRIAGTKNFTVKNVGMKDVANGGLYIEAGCENGVVDSVIIEGQSAYSAASRGIWLAGDTASDYASQLINTTSITKNATPVPIYAVKNVKIVNCTINAVEYGIYSMNSRQTVVENCTVNISDAPFPKRCIALNNYSPDSKVIGCTLIGDSSSTGILVTQYSQNVLIANNLFSGTFGGNRDIYVQYLSNALIENNRFNTESVQNIQVDMGGFAFIKNNYFGRENYISGRRCVYATPIDPTQAGSGTVGNTAQYIGGVVFQNNITRQTPLAVFVDTDSFPSASSNYPAFQYIRVKGNLFMDMNNATTSSDYPLLLTTNVGALNTTFSFTDNEVVPVTATNWNTFSVTGGAYQVAGAQAYFRSFLVSVAVSGGAITVTTGPGMDYSLAVTRSSTNLVLTPRSAASSGSPGVPPVIGVVDRGGTIYSFSVVRSGTTYVLSAKDSGGSAINFSTAAASFDVLLGPEVSA